MTRHRTQRTDAASHLWWALRRYTPLLLLLSVLGGVAGAVAASAEKDRYETSALIVATPQELGETRSLTEQLPHFAYAVFANGRVAARAIDEGSLVFESDKLLDEHVPLAIESDKLLDEHVRLEPVEFTLAIRVRGTAGDPQLARRLANGVASVLITEMNSALSEIATFKMQERARTPEATIPGRTRATAPFGVIAGIVLAAGIACLSVLARRPLIGPDEATELAGVPLLGTLRLSRKATSQAGLTPGLGAMVRRLSRDRTLRCAFVSCRGAEKEALRLASETARALAPNGRVVLVATEDCVSLSAAHDGDKNVYVVDDPRSAAIDEQCPVVIAGLSADHDISRIVPPETICALVVRVGVAQAAVEDAASQFADGELAGVVFVRSR